MHGTLEVIVGCMSSGKSEELMRLIRRAIIAKQAVIVFKPAKDTRCGKQEIASRDGRTCEAIAIDGPRMAASYLKPEHRVVAFEEAQFFSEELIQMVRDLVAQGKRVIISGLDTDFRGEAFEMLGRLMAEADRTTKLNAVCMKCGQTATRSQRFIDGQPAPYDAERYIVGGDEMYEARCRSCHEVPR